MVDFIGMNTNKKTDAVQKEPALHENRKTAFRKTDKPVGMRASGVLLHLTSLPGPFGIGDIGPCAYAFIDFLKENGQQLWQVLPLGPPVENNSPYEICSIFAGNPLLISPELLYTRGLLRKNDLADIPDMPVQQVDFNLAASIKFRILKCAWKHFQHPDIPKDDFASFCCQEMNWLDDYALFTALKSAYGGSLWNIWDKDIAFRRPQILKQWNEKLKAEINFHKFIQFLFYEQWFQLKNHASQANVRIVGDMPFYMAFNSTEVWTNPDCFNLNPETGEPIFIAGAPPDQFNVDGQLWNVPTYNWKRLEQGKFKWWLDRFKHLTRLVDIIRVDHFRGFQAFWQVRQGKKTAVNGNWVSAPGKAFFDVLKKALWELPVWVEDLGIIGPEVEHLRNRFNLPGMKILQFAFDAREADNPYLPFNYPRNCVVYTGTHDNDTTVGWFEKISAAEKRRVFDYMGEPGEEGIHWQMIRWAMGSVADSVIIPMQDILGIGSAARMNFPGQEKGQWRWRYEPGALTEDIAERLGNMTRLFGRDEKIY